MELIFIYYVSIVLDVNLTIISPTKIEVYHGDQTYDCCKPHIMIYRDTYQICHPIIYDHHKSEQLLTISDNPIIQSIVKMSTNISHPLTEII